MPRLILAALAWLMLHASAFAQCTPTIGVSGQDPTSRTVVPLMSTLRALGANPVYLEQQGANAQTDLANLDALVIAGNSDDINPARYGQKPHPKTKIETNPHRAPYEYAAIHLALQRKLPLLGICGGMQRMILAGEPAQRGSLIQHVEGQNQALGKSFTPPYITTERIGILPQTKLADIAGSTQGKVNSFHHQAPDTLPTGFIASAISEHGTIEAMEPDPTGAYAGQFAIGVMWHPEFSADPASIALMKSLIETAKIRSCR